MDPSMDRAMVEGRVVAIEDQSHAPLGRMGECCLLGVPEASCGSHLRQDTFLEVLLTQAGEDASRAQEAGFGVTG